jgi:hypothetical protein
MNVTNQEVPTLLLWLHRWINNERGSFSNVRYASNKTIVVSNKSYLGIFSIIGETFITHGFKGCYYFPMRRVKSHRQQKRHVHLAWRGTQLQQQQPVHCWVHENKQKDYRWGLRSCLQSLFIIVNHKSCEKVRR